MWFVTPFKDPNGDTVTAEIIRSRIGDFSASKKNLDRQPAKLGARLAQAFSATEPSVTMKEEEVEEVEDIKCPRLPPPPAESNEDSTEAEGQHGEKIKENNAKDVQAHEAQDDSDSEETSEVDGTTKADQEKDAPVVSSEDVYEFTDGYGTISPDLADEIWRTLNAGASELPSPAPRAYQVSYTESLSSLTINPP